MAFSPQNPNGQTVKANSSPIVIATEQEAKIDLIAKDGTDITTPTPMPTGGVGVRGWLSAIWTRLNGTQTVEGKILGATKDYYPDALPTDDTIIQEATFDVNGSLKVRASILTDEGTFRANFANTSLRVSIGTCTFTNGSNIVTGTDFSLYDVKKGDYININAHSESTLVQIDAITLTQITLVSNYAGATATGASGVQKVRSYTGTGATISVANGNATIASGTNANAVTILGRFVDVAPLVYRSSLSISQRIINQTINAGLNDDASPTKWFARFSFDGVTNTTVKCQTGRNPTVAPTGNEIQETIVTLPNGLNTTNSIDYRVELMTESVNFYINSVLVATHIKVMPSQYDFMSCGVAVINGVIAPASNTNVVVDYITCKNHNKVEIGVMSNNEAIIASQPPLQPFLFNQIGVIPINTDLIIVDCSNLRSLSIQGNTGTSGVITPAWSNDNITYFNATLVTQAGVSATTITTVAGIWTIPVQARYFKLRLTTATTAGTTNLNVQGFQINICPPILVANGTQTVSVGNTATVNLAASSIVIPVGSTAQGASTYSSTISNATNSLTQVKAGATTVNTIHVSNNSVTARYLKIFNSLSASVVMGTTNANLNYLIPANGSIPIDCGTFGIRFTTGYSIAITTGIANNDNTATGVANEVIVSTTYF